MVLLADNDDDGGGDGGSAAVVRSRRQRRLTNEIDACFRISSWHVVRSAPPSFYSNHPQDYTMTLADSYDSHSPVNTGNTQVNILNYSDIKLKLPSCCLPIQTLLDDFLTLDYL